MWSACPAVAPAMARGSSRPTWAPGAALGLLAVAGQRERIGVVAEGEQQRHGEGGARGQAGADRERAGDAGDPAARWGLQAQESGRQGGLVRAPGRCRPA